MRLLKTGKKAASVLPVPVGAINKTFLPSRMSGITSSCGRVSCVNPFSRMSLLIGLTSKEKALDNVSLHKSFKIIKLNKRMPNYG
jgi:hypothetical protein